MKLKQNIVIGLAIFCFLLDFSCKKDETTPEGGNKIELGATTVETFSYRTATISSVLISAGGNKITEHGHCWSLEKGPTINDNHTELGSKDNTGKFTSELDSLAPGEMYYVRSYVVHSLGNVYGEEKEFRTVNTGKPVVTTSKVQNVSLYAAECGGVVQYDSGLVVNARGVCWNTTGNPTLENNTGFTSDSVGLGEFTSHVTNLEEGTNYYIAAYATNEKGTGYGEVKGFITIPLNLPGVTTGSITNITTNSAMCSGTVINDGNGNIIARGICWDTITSFEVGNCLGSTINGAGLGEFTGNLTELTDGTKYFLKAYATNEKGIGYGEIKSFETVEIGLPYLTTADVINITTYSAQSGGNITNAGNGNILNRGVCWDYYEDPTINNCIGYTSDGSGMGSFTSNITELEDGMDYYVRAYATNEKGAGYGQDKTFFTIKIVIPSVTTYNITNITYTTADCGGVVTDDGNGTVTARGVCWGTSNDPTLENCLGFTTDGDGLGGFSSSITYLNSGENYFVRAYAANEKGTGYGPTRSFQTISGLPVVITADVTNITTNSADCGGNVTSEGNGSVLARGICWSNENSPSLDNCIGFTNEGTGGGIFSSGISDLDDGEGYYVVAYAINQEGTGYGLIKQFTTIDIILPTIETYEVSEITAYSATSGGNVIHGGNDTVYARGVCWSTNENPTIDDYFTTNGSGLGSFISQLTTLTPNTTYYVRAFAANIAGVGYGNQLSFMTITNIMPTVSTTDATNIAQFSATSGGNVTSNGGGTVGTRGVCWNTSGNPTLADFSTINGSGMGVFESYLTNLTPNTTYYVRSYATNEAGTAYGNQINFTTLTDILPTVTTTETSNITHNSAISGGEVISNGGGIVGARGVCWSISENPTLSDPHTTDGSGLGTFVSQLSDLTPNTTYYVRSYATNEAGTAYGDQINFITLFEDCGNVIYEGETYPTIVIGTQCWFRKNLNVGDKINGNQNQQNNSTIEKYCYSNQDNNCIEYGGLYQWNEMMQYVTNEGAQGICPDGWHIPADDEWTELTDFLGGNDVAGGKMKEEGNSHWSSPNTGATNSSGFTGLPGGYRKFFGDTFSNLGDNGYFWSSTEYSTLGGWYRRLDYDDDEIYINHYYKSYGFSVRCLQN